MISKRRLRIFHATLHRDLVDFAIEIQRRICQILLGSERIEQSLFNGHASRDHLIDMNGICLSHPIRSSNPLLEHRWIPGEVDIDHGVGSLQIQPRRTGIGHADDSAIGIVLESGNQFRSFLLRNLTIEPNILTI